MLMTASYFSPARWLLAGGLQQTLQRHGARFAAAWLLGACVAGGAQAQAAYPAKPVRVVVAFTAGGTTDILTRLVSHQLSERLKQPFVIERIGVSTTWGRVSHRGSALNPPETLDSPPL